MPTTINPDGIRLHFDIHDYTDPWVDAPYLLLQHGFGKSSKIWHRLIPYLARHYKVVCPDLRGLGQSSADFDLATGVNLDAYISDLSWIVEQLAVGRVHYAGESLAGILGMMFAAQHPDRVRTLTLLSSPPSIGSKIQETYSFGHASWADAIRSMGWVERSRMSNAVRFPPETDPGLLEWFNAITTANKEEVAIAMARLIPTVDATGFLAQIKVPVLGIYPTNGPNVSAEHERILTQSIRDMHLIHLKGNYHTAWMLEPATCAKHMLYFMAYHDRRNIDE